MASIYDVAKKAGVSKTLVSRVINGQSGVGPESRRKIASAMKELNYTPNAIARSLVLQKTHIIGVVLDSLCEPFFFDLIRGIESKVEASGYDVIFCSSRDSSRIKSRYIDFFSQGRADGFILYGSSLGDTDLIQNLESSSFPFVVVENDVGERNMNNIAMDNRYGSRIAVEYLQRRGCKTICHVTGDMKTKAAIHRQEGFVQAMQDHNLPLREGDLVAGDFSVSAGYQAIASLLERTGRDNLPDAFYFGADNTAYGGLMALEDKGISVPEDVMVVGFDNDTVHVPGRLLKPLTTVAQPMFDMGQAAVRVLLHDMEAQPEVKEKTIFYPELLIRETTR